MELQQLCLQGIGPSWTRLFILVSGVRLPVGAPYNNLSAPPPSDNLLSLSCNVLQKPSNLLSKVPLFTVIWYREIIREIISAFRGFQTSFFRLIRLVATGKLRM